MNNNQDMAQYLGQQTPLKHFASDPIFIYPQLVLGRSNQDKFVRREKYFKGIKK